MDDDDGPSQGGSLGGSGGAPRSQIAARHVNVYSQLQLEQASDISLRICHLLLEDEFYRNQLVALMTVADEHAHFGVNIK